MTHTIGDKPYEDYVQFRCASLFDGLLNKPTRVMLSDQVKGRYSIVSVHFKESSSKIERGAFYWLYSFFGSETHFDPRSYDRLMDETYLASGTVFSSAIKSDIAACEARFNEKTGLLAQTEIKETSKKSAPINEPPPAVPDVASSSSTVEVPQAIAFSAQFDRPIDSYAGIANFEAYKAFRCSAFFEYLQFDYRQKDRKFQYLRAIEYLNNSYRFNRDAIQDMSMIYGRILRKNQLKLPTAFWDADGQTCSNLTGLNFRIVNRTGSAGGRFV